MIVRNAKIIQLLMILGLSGLITACQGKSYREQFFKDRPCKAIQFHCLQEAQPKPTRQANKPQEAAMIDPNKPYQLSKQEMDAIKQHKTERMYDEITQMLDIFYPDFWMDKDKDFQMAWVAKVDEITKRYYGQNRWRETLEKMVLICAIIGSDFEDKPELDFIVKRLKSDGEIATSPILILNWLRFEILEKDYDITGTQYNTWSLRGARTGMPPITRHIPSFSDEWLPDNPDENELAIYLDTVKNGGRRNHK